MISLLHIFVVAIFFVSLRPETARWLLSKSLNTVLHLAYPIQHRSKRYGIPSLDFQWPNGQGTEKFFHGHSAAQRWRSSMGGLYRIWSGFQPEVVLTDASHTRPYFRTSNHHVKAANNNSGWLFGEVLGSCVGLVSGERWKALRAEVDPFFTQSAAQAHTASIVQSARQFVSRELPPQASPDWEDASILSVNPANALQFFPFLVVAGMLFGEPLSPAQTATLRDLAPLREELFQEVIRGGWNRWGFLAKLFRSKGFQLLAQFEPRWQAFVEDAYQGAKKAQTDRNANKPEDIRSPSPEKPRSQNELPIIRLWEAVQQGRISTRECLQTLDESLYANLDVTTNAVSWNIVLLAQNPDVQAQLRQEVLQIRQADPHAYVQYVDRSDTFLAACVVESARLRPILPFSNPEASPTQDITLGDFTIPRNTNVVVDSHAINVSNPYWTDGEKYNPGRHFALRKEQVRYNLWRFGFGPRQCLGKHFAERMLRCITAEMVARYMMSVPETHGSKREVKFQKDSWVSLPDAVIRCVPVSAQGHGNEVQTKISD